LALRRSSPKAGYCGVKLVQTTLRDRKQFAAVARQRHVPTRPVEKPESELPLEFANHHAQTGRSDEEGFRRAGETPMLRHKQEGTKLARREIHH